MKDLDYYLEELARKRISIKDEDELRSPKGRKEDWLDEEPEDEENDYHSEEDDSNEDIIDEKLENILNDFFTAAEGQNDPDENEKINKLTIKKIKELFK